MTEKAEAQTEKVQAAVSALIRRATIDINQAGNYYLNSEYDHYTKNLKEVQKTLEELAGYPFAPKKN